MKWLTKELEALQNFGVNRPTLSTLNLRMVSSDNAWGLSIHDGVITTASIILVTIMLLLITVFTICYVRAKKRKEPPDSNNIDSNSNNIDSKSTLMVKYHRADKQRTGRY